MLEEFGPNIWITDGPIVSVLGFRYPTRMAIIRLQNGDLFIWSPVALTDALRTDIKALGPVRHIVTPNHLHHLFFNEWAGAYPDAKTYAPPRLRDKRKDIRFDEDLTKTSVWSGDIDQVIVEGNLITTEVVFHHKESQTTIFCDLLQNFPKGWHSGMHAFIAKRDLMVEPTPTVPRKFRVATVNRKKARAAVTRITKWPTQKVLTAHGTPQTENGQPFIKQAFDWLL